MNVIIIIPTLSGGGAEKQVRLLVENLTAEVTHIHLVTRRIVGKVQYEVDVHLIPDVGGVTIGALKKLNELQRRLGDNTVTISFLRQANVIVGVLRLFKSFAWLSSERSDPHKEFGLYVILERFLKRRSLVLANSKSAVRFYENRGYKVKYLPNILTANIYSKQPSKKQQFVVLGRIIKDKRVDFILDAWAKANIAGQLTIIGEGPFLLELKSKALNLNLQNVTFKGHMDNPNEELEHSSFYISASLREGMPNAAIEALAANNILILNNIDNHLDIVQGTEHLLYESDSLDSLVTVLRKCENFSKKHRKKIILENKTMLKKYEPYVVIKQLKRILIESLIFESEK